MPSKEHCWKVRRAFGTLTAVLSFLTACGLMSPYGGSTERWRGVDPSTNPPTPVSGATVLLTYHGTAFAPGHSSSACVAAALVKSGEHGYFDVPEPQGGRRVMADPYKPNHAYREIGAVGKGREVYLLANPTTQAQLRYFNSLFGAANCAQLMHGESAIVEFIETLLPELSRLTGTREGAKRIELFRNLLKDRRIAAANKRASWSDYP